MNDLHPAGVSARWSLPYALVKPVLTALALFVSLSALAWAADLYRLAGWNFLAEQFLSIVLGAAMAIVYITTPFNPKKSRIERGVPLFDLLLAVLSLGVGLYYSYFYPSMLDGFFRPESASLVATWVMFCLLLEALRRSAGLPLVVVIGLFVGYAMIGHLVEGDLQTRKVDLNQMIYYLNVDTSGMLGLVLLIGVTVVVPFVFFGQLLGASGGAGFFNDLALGLMGRYRGGAAKIAVLASSLFGSINGIVVSNILATGVITIPLMKKSGFSPEKAAAIEASASNGGQLMPPVMGAVAFLMADFLRISYADVALAALVPSLLYYLALFIQSDLEAAKDGVDAVPKSAIPRLMKVLAMGWAFVLPFAVLIYALFWLNKEAENAALYACAGVIVVGLALGYGGERLNLKKIWDCIIETGLSSASIIMIAAAAGFIMGILQLTGLGFAMTMYLVGLGSSSVFLLLIVAAVLCIILGMGMPTLGVYVLLAVLIAPALVEAGVTPIAAHMFILYLGMMSFVTPPVAIGAFFAANLAKASPMRTAWIAMRYSWVAYVIPFLFVFSPTLLLQEGSVAETLLAIGTAAVGIWFVSAGMVGFGLRRMPMLWRVVSFAAGAMLLIPIGAADWALMSNILGAGLALAVLGVEYAGRVPKLVSKPSPDTN
jgi:TRAP transporter 4TM/12TM fusion protein